MLGIKEKTFRDEAELRAFYQSVGLSPETIERAIAAKFKQPVPEARGKWARKKATPAAQATERQLDLENGETQKAAASGRR